MKDNLNFGGHIHIPFSPVLMEYDLPEPYVKMLNDYGDKISANEEKSKNLDVSKQLAGNTKQELHIEEEVWGRKAEENLPTLIAWLGGCANLYVKSSMKALYSKEAKDIKSIQVLEGWITNQIAGDWNPFHSHGGMISGAGWLEIPESIEKDQERDQAGYLEFFYGAPQMFLNPSYFFKPKVGKMVLFPSWLWHQVQPFRGKGLRRSFSFNLATDLGDLYKKPNHVGEGY